MIRKAKSHSHRFFPISPRIFWDKRYFLWHARFEPSCAYFIKGEDQSDINKLCGISNWPHPRIESIRIGWRYNQITQKIELGVYSEKSYRHNWYQLCSVDFGEDVLIDLFLNGDETATVQINNSRSIRVGFDYNRLLFGMNPYFGGNLAAPHTMELYLNQII